MSKTTDGWDWVGIPSGMPTEMAIMLNALADGDEDDTPRVVAADMLEEYGRGDWAKFIRRQCGDLAKCDDYGSGIRLCSCVYWPVGMTGGNRVTFERLARACPWDYRNWQKTEANGYHIGCVEMASASYQEKSATVYPRVRWFRGFMSTILTVGVMQLFRMVERGEHAWHPWNVPGPFDSHSSQRFMDELTGFRLNAEADFDELGVGSPGAGGGHFYHHYFNVARRDHMDRLRWTVQGSGDRVYNLRVVPEPVARFLTGYRGERTFGRVYYPTYNHAIDDLNKAAKLFMREAGKHSRLRVIANGGTH